MVNVRHNYSGEQIAVFPPPANAENVSLSVEIQGTQSGSGDPSPTNVRPLVPAAIVAITRAGPQLLDVSAITDRTTLDTGGQETGSTGYAVSDFIPVSGSSMLFVGHGEPGTSSSYRFRVCAYDASREFLDMRANRTPRGELGTQTVSIAGAAYIRVATLRYYMTEPGTMDVFQDPDEAFVALPSPVYAGTLDVLTGAVEARPYYAAYAGETLAGPWLSSMDVYTPGTRPTVGAEVVDLGGALTASAADPEAIAWDSTGLNYIWSGSGPVSLSYWLGTAVDDLPADVLQALRGLGVRKNLRLHFPGGELPDITNANVVAESLRFDESVCSQDVFRFGLTEASVLEVETVGVPNMMGMTFEASLEYGPADALICAVPLGVFRVAECPRNHQRMAHRRVLAYSVGADFPPAAGSFERQKSGVMLQGAAYVVPALQLAVTLMGASPEQLTVMGFSGAALAYDSTPGSVYPEITVAKEFKTAAGAAVAVTTTTAYRTAHSGQDLVTADYGQIDYSAARAAAQTHLEGLGVDYTQSGFPSLDALVDDALNVSAGLAVPSVVYGTREDGSGVLSYDYSAPAVPIPGSEAVLPARASGVATIQIDAQIRVPVNITWTSGGQIMDVFDADGGEDSFFTSWTAPAGLAAANPLLSFAPTLRAQKTLSYGRREVVSFANAFPRGQQLANGLFELLGLFLRPSRSGGYEILDMSAGTPVALGPADYVGGEMWWDEYGVAPIGTVRVAFGAEGAEETADIVIGDGESVYDMSDNIILRNLSAPTLVDVAALIQTAFAPRAQLAAFTPVDLTMPAQPHIQAGAALQITAEDGTVVNTFMLRREMSGIQALFDTVSAAGGEIIEEAST